jgi:translocation and assembly module TamB
MTRKRIVRIGAAALAAIAVLSVAATLLVIRSQWFYNQVRLRVINTVETATGGRVDAGSFRFDWKRLRAEIKAFTLHGNEPSGRPPLLHADSIAVGLKVVSLLKRDVDIQYLDVVRPHVYLVVYPDGRTNVPEPKTARRGPNAVETILNLAIGRFSAANGVFEVENRGATPFDAQGRNVSAHFSYEAGGPRYRADVSIKPLDLHLPGRPALPFSVQLAATVENNRIGITSAKLATGDSRAQISGTIDNLASPHGTFQYSAHVSLADISRILHVEELQRGSADVAGYAAWQGSANFSASGKLHAYGVDYRDSTITLRGCRADGILKADAGGIDLRDVRLSGNYVSRLTTVPVGGQVSGATLHGRQLELRGVALAALGGTFEGQAWLRDLKYYSVEGTAAGFEAKRVIALYSPEPLPWNARGSGSLRLEGTLGRKQDLRVSASLEVTPAAGSAPVHGTINAAYEARGRTLDLGRSTLWLPSSRVDFAGVFGGRMQLHLETRDLNDLMPVLGANAAGFPVQLNNGSAVFDGTVSGDPDNLQLAGHLRVNRLAWAGQTFDSLDSAVSANPNSLRFDNATVTRGRLRAQFSAAAGPRDWKIDESSPIAGSGTVRNADVAELAATLGAAEIPITGTAGGTVQLAGIIGKPIFSGDLDVTNGSFRDEPFDRFTARVNYGGREIRVQSGHIAAGGKQLELSGSFEHAADRFDQGRLHLSVATNAMPIEQIRMLQKVRPGATGTVRINGAGDFDVVPAGGSGPTVRIAALRADVAATGVRLTGQALGDARLSIDSQGQVLRARLDSDFANSNIHGEGEWRLEKDYPGSAKINFSRLDFGQLRAWISTAPAAADRITGYAEGELRISGPALKPAATKAELVLPKLEIGAAKQAAGVPNGLAGYTLRNSGPVVATMAGSVVTISSAHLTGRDSDLTIGGRVLVDQKNPLDLRVNGKINLAILHALNEDFVSSGFLSTDATVRGAFDSPQLNGRMQFEGASFNVVDFPNGISNASGVLLLNGTRATIQRISGETGGGTIELSGFASYGDVLVFQVRAAAHEVRVRYPEGVSTVADANLNLTGTSDRSMLSGTITILRTGFNPQSDFSSLIAKSAEPVRTPSSRTGLLGGLNFDVQITTAPDIQFQSTLTQDLQVESNLQLRGNVSNPALLGRITVTQGQLVFYGTRYNINQGSISFYNPVKVEPVLDIDLETKLRGIDITLSVTGPLNKPKLTPRSDPPLQFQEIVALLATGRTPTSDPTLLAQQSTMPQSWQQMGATALLGQAIASPVTGRLQRFFGVSKLRIDPTLPGVENNPQARLTLEQQITPGLTLTYITNVTTTNPQVVRVEWNVNKQWSLVLLRDENATFGMDFFFKKRF